MACSALPISPGDYANGCRVFVHYNGPTEQLRGVCTGLAVLDPGASPHPPHRHPEEEFLIIAEGTGVIECEGKTDRGRTGRDHVLRLERAARHHEHRKVPLTFYWSKWIAKGF